MISRYGWTEILKPGILLSSTYTIFIMQEFHPKIKNPNFLSWKHKLANFSENCDRSIRKWYQEQEGLKASVSRFFLRDSVESRGT